MYGGLPLDDSNDDCQPKFSDKSAPMASGEKRLISKTDADLEKQKKILKEEQQLLKTERDKFKQIKQEFEDRRAQIERDERQLRRERQKEIEEENRQRAQQIEREDRDRQEKIRLENEERQAELHRLAERAEQIEQENRDRQERIRREHEEREAELLQRIEEERAALELLIQRQNENARYLNHGEGEQEAEEEAEEEAEIEEVYNMAQLRQNDFLPTSFNGTQNARSHFLSYEDYCTIHDLQEPDRIARFKLTLSGEARQWIEGKQFATFQEMKNQFIRYFTGAHTNLGTTAQFRNLKYIPGETLEKYASRIRALAEEGGINDQMCVSQFMIGLPSSLRKDLASTGLDNLNALVERGQLILDLNGETQNNETTPVYKEVSFVVDQHPEKNEALGRQFLVKTDQISAKTDKLSAEIGALSTQLESIQVSQGTNDFTRQQKPNNSRRGRPGRGQDKRVRFRESSPYYSPNRQNFQGNARPGQGRNYNRRVRCFKCGRDGHIVPQCRATNVQFWRGPPNRSRGPNNRFGSFRGRPDQYQQNRQQSFY